MPPIVESLIPILLITFLGWRLNYDGVVTQDQWNGFERVIYQVFFPALIIHTLAMADLSKVPLFGVGVGLLAALSVVCLALLALAPLLRTRFAVDGPAFTSHFQGATRWNTFVAISLCGSLYGPRGLTLVAVAVAAILPFINVVSVLVMRRFVGGGEAGRMAQFIGILKNPFVWSSLVGAAISFAGVPMPKPLADGLDILGRASLGAALLLVGSGLRFADMTRPTVPLALTCALKLIILPLLAAGIARSLGVSGADLGVVVICAAVPTAGASYILARQMGGDARLMANIITTETLLSAVTLPAMLLLLVG